MKLPFWYEVVNHVTGEMLQHCDEKVEATAWCIRYLQAHPEITDLHSIGVQEVDHTGRRTVPFDRPGEK